MTNEEKQIKKMKEDLEEAIRTKASLTDEQIEKVVGGIKKLGQDGRHEPEEDKMAFK